MKKKAKYIEIIDYYKNEIENGHLKEGDILPFENEICTQFNVSHMTFTKAMNELAIKGYIHRIPKKGTIVSSAYKKRVKKQLFEVSSITSQIVNAGMKPRSELYKYAILKGKDIPEIAKILSIKENEYIHYFIRLRYADADLICISYTYVSQAIIPTIDITCLEGSFNEYVNKLGIQRSYGKSEFCATLPSTEQAKIIGNSHIPLLKQTIFWHANNSPFELTYHYFIGEQYSVTQDLRIILDNSTDNK